MLDEDQIYKSTIHKTEISIADEEGLFSSFDRDLIEYLYNEFLSLEDRQPQKAPDKKISRIPFPVDLLRDAIDMLSSTCYDGLPIIVEEEQNVAINDEISSKIINKIEGGLQINKLERIIMDVGILIAGGYQIDGKVNSESDFNENSFEKAKENIARLKVIGESMAGISELYSGAEVPMRLMPEGTQYKKGDIIVFYRDEIKIVHQVECVFESDGNIFYVTTGVNTETNQYVDSSLVSQDDVIGAVDLSKEAYLKLNEMMARRYVPFIKAFGLAQAIIIPSEKVLHNALEKVQNFADENGLTVISSKDHNKEISVDEFKEACIEARMLGKENGDARLMWKHEDCGTIWENSYNNIKRNIGTCPKCDSRYINQKITLGISEHIFGEKFEVEKNLVSIFPQLKTDSKYANIRKIMSVNHMHVDMYVEFIIDGKLIRLAVEYNGEQHNPDPAIGYEAYKAITRGKGTYQDWQRYLVRDEFKVELFENHNDDGYFLIVVDYQVDASDRQEFIINEFESQTGIKLPPISKIDWRLLK